jgi:5'-3' exonuclease
VNGPALLVDGNNLAMRAVHAAKHSTMTAAGVNTGPLTIFIDSLAAIVRMVEPTSMAIAWDRGSSIRHQLIEGYKANRHEASEIGQLKNDSFQLISDLLYQLHIHQASDYGFEADDIIAYWWRELDLMHAGSIVIASSDKDFLQLVGLNPHGLPTRLLRLSSADTPSDWWTELRMVEELGFTPEQWPLITSLAGDRADNILGIPNIGPKRAQKLLEAHGWNLVTALKSAHPEYLLRVQDNLLAVNLRVQAEDPDVSMPAAFEPHVQLHTGLREFLAHFKLKGLSNKIERDELWRAPKLPGRPLQLKLPLSDPSA